MSSVERHSEGDNHKHMDFRNTLQIASLLMMIGGIGEFANLTFRTVPQMKKELEQKAPVMYKDELVQQARREVIIFEKEIKQLILEDKTDDILNMVQQPNLKKSIQIAHDQDNIGMQRARITGKISCESLFYPKVIISTFGCVLGALGVVAFSREEINKSMD